MAKKTSSISAASDDKSLADEAKAQKPDAYRVLARKYRPRNFAELIGQDNLVHIMQNAIRLNRVHHAFILTGVRGVGKTTTARLIAKTLNCEGGDASTPVFEPCNQCASCIAIGEDRHMDVQEMDAASRTSVDDIRELIEAVKYKPSSAKRKIYILDEVHMLSQNAFNALLKTLEEPPDHVTFIFATTEIRKVPITILSRCQRFDLARVKSDILARHFADIAEKEGVDIDDKALKLIASAADGSVRDGLSLLDQAIALSDMNEGKEGKGKKNVSGDNVANMLGLSDREIIFDLLDDCLKGDGQKMQMTLGRIFEVGTDPLQVIQDLLDLTHALTRFKVAPQQNDAQNLSELEYVHGKPMAEKLSLPQLSRIWQVLFKGLQDIRMAHNAQHVLEMVLIRLIYLHKSPPLDELIRKAEQQQQQQQQQQTAIIGVNSNLAGPQGGGASYESAVVSSDEGASLKKKPEIAGYFENLQSLADFMYQNGEAILGFQLKHYVQLIKLDKGVLIYSLADGGDEGLHKNLREALGRLTKMSWHLEQREQAGAKTLHASNHEKNQAILGKAEQDIIVKEIKKYFKGARIIGVNVNEVPENVTIN